MSTETTTHKGNGAGSKEAAVAALAHVPRPMPAQCADWSPLAGKVDLTGRTLYFPRMPWAGSRLLSSAFESIGIKTKVVPESTTRTLEVGGRYTSGDECYPQKIVIGGFAQLIEDDKIPPNELAFMLPTANGPCRFGQYAALLRVTLDRMGLQDVPILSLTSADGYAGVGEQAQELIRTAWRAVVTNDILLKLLLKTRPYEVDAGQTDEVYTRYVEMCAGVIGRQTSHKQRMADLKEALARAKDSFAAIPVRHEDRPLIGVVGEIFCRLNTFANMELIRELERQGAECWLAGVAEWVWYTTEERFRRYREEKRRFGKEWLKAFITKQIQLRDEHALHEGFHEVFKGYEELGVTEILDLADPYLSKAGTMGEMILSTGGTIFFHNIGADGVVDISPFSCMNGIVTEAIYPKLSRDLDNFPIRIFYFDGTQSDLERDVGIFLELARTYKRRKKVPRRV